MSNIELRPTYWASVSGGKDSLYMLKYILDNMDRYPLDGVVHFELEMDFPFIKSVIDYMETECNRFGIPFLRIRPKNTWMELYNKYGYPSRIGRWCNSKYKLDASRQLERLMKQQGKKVIHYVGFCADEPKRFRFDLNERTPNVTQIYPLAEAGIRENDIWLWARNVPQFNDYYKFNFRCGCMMCPLSSIKCLAYTFVYYPEEFAKYMDLAKQTEKKHPDWKCSVWGCTDYDSEYVINRIKTKYLPLKELGVK